MCTAACKALLDMLLVQPITLDYSSCNASFSMFPQVLLHIARAAGGSKATGLECARFLARSPRETYVLPMLSCGTLLRILSAIAVEIDTRIIEGNVLFHFTQKPSTYALQRSITLTFALR